MKTKIVITTVKDGDGGLRRSEVWSGEMNILDDEEYLVEMSIIAEGKPQPIVNIPFSPGRGHYLWIPGDNDALEDEDHVWNLN